MTEETKKNTQRKCKKFESYGMIAGVVSFIITFSVLFGSYIADENQQTATILLEDIPLNAIKDNGVQRQSVNWQGNNISSQELKSIIVPDTDYFKIDQMDSIKLSIAPQNFNKASIRIFIRGIKYDRLPFVFDYQKTIDLEPTNITKGEYFLRQYELKKINLPEKSPWIITAEYYKENLLRGIIDAGTFAVIAGLIIWGMTVLLFILSMVLVKKLKMLKR